MVRSSDKGEVRTVSMLGFLVMAAAVEETRYDHTQDIAAVAQLLADVRNGAASDDSISVTNRDEPTNSSFAAFVSYANTCQIEKIYAIPSASQPLPINVIWDCNEFEKVDGKLVWIENSAGFWVVDGRVTRIVFGQTPTINLPVAKLKAED